MAFKAQRSFAKGEIAPELQSRADTTAYQQALATCKNFIVQKFGGVTKRPGTQYVGPCGLSNSTTKSETNLHVKGDAPRLIPWSASDNNSYVLEFSEKRMRVIYRGNYAYDLPAITGIRGYATNGTITMVRTPDGQEPFKRYGIALITDIPALPELNNRFVKMSGFSAGGTTFVAHTMDGAAITLSANVAEYGRGQVRPVFELSTAIETKHLAGLKYSMSNNILTLTHPDLPIFEVRKTGIGHNCWEITKAFPYNGNVETGSVVVKSTTTGKSVVLSPPTAQMTDARFRFTDSTVNKAKPWKRYAISTVDGDGNESLSCLTDYLQKQTAAQMETYHDEWGQNVGGIDSMNVGNIRLGFVLNKKWTPNMNNAGWFTGSSVTFDTGSDDYTQGASYWGSGLKVTISSYDEAQPANGSVFSVDDWRGMKDNDRFTVEGTDYFGNQITETLDAASITDGGTSNYSKNIRLTTENYFKEVFRVRSSINAKGFDFSDAGDVDSYFVELGYTDWDWDNVTISWNPPANIAELPRPVVYKVYRSDGGRYGLIGIMDQSTTDTTGRIRFVDNQREADYTTQPFTAAHPFPSAAADSAANYNYSPTAVCHYQQRRLFAGSDAYNGRIWCSGIARLGDFNTRNDLKDSDPFYFDVASDKNQRIYHLLSLNKVVVFTENGEWVLEGSDSGTVTPTQVNARQLSHCGSGPLSPEMIGNDAIFYQPRGSIVRDLGYTFAGSHGSGDLSLFAYHLLRGNKIVSWAYQREPNSTLWCAREDGKLIGLTYVKEHEIVAWHVHEIGGGGLVRSVCVVPEDGTDNVYFVVERTGLVQHDNQRVFSVERLTKQYIADAQLYAGSDSSVSYSGWRTDGSNVGTLQVSAAAAPYTGTSVGKRVVLTTTQPWFRKRKDVKEETTKTVTVEPADFLSAMSQVTSQGTYGMEAISAAMQISGLPGTTKQVTSTQEYNVTMGSVGMLVRPSKWHAPRTGTGAQPIFKILSVTSDYTAVAEITSGTAAYATYNTWCFNFKDMINSSISLAQYLAGGWDAGATVTVTSTASEFAGTVVGDRIYLGSRDNIECTLTATNITGSPSSIRCTVDVAVPTAYRTGTHYTWARCFKTIQGLSHLAGEEVSVWADGVIQSSPNNSGEATLTVSMATATHGSLTLTTPAAIVVVGLPYDSDVETLDIDSPTGDVGDKNIKVTKVVSHVHETIGGFIGSELPDAEGSTQYMVSIDLSKISETDGDAKTGKYTTIITPDWGSNGRVAIRQVDPTPITILSVTPSFDITDRRVGR